MRLESVHPGITPEQVKKATGFDLPVSPDLTETPAPTEEALEVLRREVDPLRYIIGR